MIVVVDYGMGNLGSILNMLKKIGAPAAPSQDKKDIRQADKLILPGVGAFDQGVRNLRGRGYDSALEDSVLRRGAPFLGICLGMQLLTRRSDEGGEKGLGWIDADTVRFPAEAEGRPLRVPHMGWNEVKVVRPSPLFEGNRPLKFYFAHSYFVRCDHDADVAAQTVYGGAFASSVQKGRVFGVQFHPEKSHRYGLDLLRRFAEL